MWISPGHKRLQYSGRIDFTEKEAPIFIFPCSSVRVRFTGSFLKVRLRNRRQYWENYMGYIADGKEGKFFLENELVSLPGEEAHVNCGVLYEIPLDPDVEEHEVLLFKRQDACHEVTFLGFETDESGEVLEPPARPRRRIEVYGDSVSAGEVSEAVGYTGRPDPKHNGQYSNSRYSYAWITAERLGAELHDVAQGGIALLDKTGWFNEPDQIGMESVWDKVHYNPAFGPTSEWRFEEYTPQVVIAAIGQNDSHPEDYMKEDYDGVRAAAWRDAYGVFLRKIREKYPQSRIVCITTLLEHDPAWDRSIDAVCEGMHDEKIRHFMFRRNGRGTPGHLRISEAEEMAEELSAYIESLDIGW